MKILRMSLVIALSLAAFVVQAQDDKQRYRTGQFKVGDRVLADAIGLGAPDSCTVIGTTELTGSFMPGYTNQLLLRCDHKAWSSVAATADRVKPGGEANVVANGSAAAQQPPAGSNAYGTRNPRTCEAFNGSSISPAQAAQLVTCSHEKISGGQIYLVDDVKVTSISTGHYDPRTQTGFTNMDTSLPPKEIEGSLVQSICGPVDAKFDSPYNNYGKNCNRINQKHAKGYCFKQRTGAWSCSMSDVMVSTEDKQYRVGPPH
ncbi:MAG: hypothetical protein ABI564_16200 [Ideonella sp.]